VRVVAHRHFGYVSLAWVQAVRETDEGEQEIHGHPSAYLPSSLALDSAVLLRLGMGILHSMEKATQFVHGTLRDVSD
jgi:hypothetical protein